MAEPMRKDKAHELVERMPENATWDDLIDEIYVRQVIEQGLADSQAGRATDVEEVRRKYGLQE
jgi:predicted transcriptional regulator